MDLRAFIEQHTKANTLNDVQSGFSKSLYAESTNDTANLIKTILSKLTFDTDRQRIYNQLQSGGLANNSTANKSEAKKQSYCTEFNTMISNLMCLIGFELSKYVLVWAGAKHYMIRIVNALETASNYDDIETLLIVLRNITEVGIETGQETPIKLVDFPIDSYTSMKTSNKGTFDYFDGNANDSDITRLFNWLLKEVRVRIQSENIVTFVEDRSRWHSTLSLMLDHIVPGTYIIDTIDELVVNLGSGKLDGHLEHLGFNLDACYDKSFIKMFDILYNESFADLPSEVFTNAKPHALFVEKELELDVKCTRYTANFNKYFHKVVEDSIAAAQEALGTNILRIMITNELYERLSDITLNMFITMGRKIANNQIIYAYFGKSTRIQFIQVFQAIMDCAPRMHIFTPAQQAILHYILLSPKVLAESIGLVNGTPVPVIPTKRPARTKGKIPTKATSKKTTKDDDESD